jgi:predicted nucleotidyltransferase
MNIHETLRRKREEILRITERYGARNVRVFGSVARGENDEQSDVDFLVRIESGVTLLKHAAMVRELEALLGCKVDVVSESGLRPRMRERVLKEAAPL